MLINMTSKVWLTSLSSLLNLQTSYDIKMEFYHSVHYNTATVVYSPKHVTSEIFQVNCCQKRGESMTRSSVANWFRRWESKDVYCRTDAWGKFRPDFSLNYRLSTVTEVTRHNRIPQFRAASRTPNNSTAVRRPTFDPDKASFPRSARGARFARSFDAPLFERKIYFVSSTRSQRAITDIEKKMRRSRGKGEVLRSLSKTVIIAIMTFVAVKLIVGIIIVTVIIAVVSDEL